MINPKRELFVWGPIEGYCITTLGPVDGAFFIIYNGSQSI